MIAIGLIIAGIVIEGVVFVSIFLAWHKIDKKSDLNITFYDVARNIPGFDYYVTAQLVGGLAILVGVMWGVIDLIQIVF